MRKTPLLALLLSAAASVAFIACDVADPGSEPELEIKTQRGKPGKADGVPSGWDCSANFYGTDDGCDCGCGIVDPDCDSGAASQCDYEWCANSAEVSTTSNWECIEADGDDDGPSDSQPPGAWTCSDNFYGTNDGCDCGCGVVDPDCPSSSAAACDYEWCSGSDPVSSANHQCGDSGSGDGNGDDDGDDDGSSSGALCDHVYACAPGYICSYDASVDPDRRCRYRGTYAGECYELNMPQWDCSATNCWEIAHCGVDEACVVHNDSGAVSQQCVPAD